MNRRKRGTGSCRSFETKSKVVENDHRFTDLIEFVIPESGLFSKNEFHGMYLGIVCAHCGDTPFQARGLHQSALVRIEVGQAFFAVVSA